MCVTNKHIVEFFTIVLPRSVTKEQNCVVLQKQYLLKQQSYKQQSNMLDTSKTRCVTYYRIDKGIKIPSKSWKATPDPRWNPVEEAEMGLSAATSSLAAVLLMMTASTSTGEIPKQNNPKNDREQFESPIKQTPLG